MLLVSLLIFGVQLVFCLCEISHTFPGNCYDKCSTALSGVGKLLSCRELMRPFGWFGGGRAAFKLMFDSSVTFKNMN